MINITITNITDRQAARPPGAGAEGAGVIMNK